MTMSERPQLSVVIPAYNYAATVTRAVESVLAQLHEASAELLVIDDGSTDQTPQVLADLQARFPGTFRVLRKDNGGLSSVRNRGIDEARGDFLIFLDADDEMAPGALQTLSEHLKSNPSSKMIIGGHWSVFADGKRALHQPPVLSESPLARVRDYLIDKRIALSNGACAMHRDVFEPGRYPESFRSAEDIPVFAQVLGNYPCTVLAQPLALIHKHDDSLRHQFQHAKAGGLALVDEVFASQRLGPEFQVLRAAFYAQRSLSLFRSAYLAGDRAAAKQFFRAAVRQDWRVLFKLTYARKALRVWLGLA
ncbi:glycosyltransferase family 2 protein [Aquipseudomonas ullengensis]|uniref:Glycosyltransferase family 2 protein n=1 Tax=Aquipseudomonas ullengensis TaxID=2759166 RepID=A0A7W4Q8L4_9GAMM|nr:glycosyltransferase family 2 protein [Pseudomonas ullengensis]MBB2493754.1 glycosyltransferase family 2 protein [Pseudomonas ullengensis]